MEKRAAILWVLTLLFQQILIQGDVPLGKRRDKLENPKIQKGPSAGILLRSSPGFLITERQILHQNVLVELDPIHTFAKMRNASSMSPEMQVWFEEFIENARQEIREMLDQLRKVFLAQPAGKQQHRQKRFMGFLISAVVMAVLGAVVGTTMSAMNSISVQQLDHKMLEMNAAILSLSKHLESTRDSLHQVISFVNDTAVTINQHEQLLQHSIRLHEKAHQQQEDRVMYKEPLQNAVRKLLRETQDSIQALISGKVPLYLISVEMMKSIYMRSYGQETEEIQIALAFEMSSSCVTYLDVEMMRVGFVLNIPYILPQNTYMLKKVLNVGVWKGNLLWAVKTPTLVSFLSQQDNVYLVPDLTHCTTFKTINYLCAGKPFKPNSTQLLCGIKPNSSVENCLVEVSQPNVEEQTKVELVGQQWLVNSNQKTMTVHYIPHGTTTQILYPQSVSLVSIPRGVVATIGGKVLFHVGDEPEDVKLELVDTFNGKQFEGDADLEFLLKHKSNHTLKLNLHEPNITMTNFMYTDSDQQVISQQNWINTHNLVYMLVLGIILFWALGITIQVCINTHKLQHRSVTVLDTEYRMIPASGRMRNTGLPV